MVANGGKGQRFHGEWSDRWGKVEGRLCAAHRRSTPTVELLSNRVAVVGSMEQRVL